MLVESGLVGDMAGEIRFLHLEAERARTAALSATSPQARRGLEQLASHYSDQARQLNIKAG